MNVIGTTTLLRREIERFLRVVIQTLITPWITASLYILVFGSFVGSRIGEIDGVPYIRFVLPGVIMMNVITAAFMNTSSSLHFQRFLRHIEEILVAPISYAEMIFAFVASGVVRGVVVGIGIYIVGIVFGAAGVAHPFWFFFYVVSVSAIFSFLGLVWGLWSNAFESLAILPTFVITPLSFLGGMFNSIHMLPTAFQTFVRLNPIFYLVDGMRYSMTGISESDRMVGLALIAASAIGLFFWVWRLFTRGWHLRT